MSEEEKKRGRPSMNTKSYHVKIEGDLAEVLDTQSNKNRYVNESLRMKMERDGLIKRSKPAKKSD
jgi:hypothetical protein